MQGHRVAACAALLLVGLVSRISAATGVPRATFVTGGLNLGSGTARGESAVIAGVESSIVHLEELAWVGAYGDAVYSFGEQHARLSLGPEFGIGPFGLDGGYVVAIGEGGPQQGVAIRPMLTVGLVALYYRYEQLSGRSLPRNADQRSRLCHRELRRTRAPTQRATTLRREGQAGRVGTRGHQLGSPSRRW